jgi:hypothetical protein
MKVLSKLKRKFKTLLKKIKAQRDALTDRYFVHDLRNHIHGIDLFLDHKRDLHAPLSLIEIEKLQHELMQMKELINRHYQHESVPLVINLVEAKRLVKCNLEKFLNRPQFKLSLKIEPLLFPRNKGIESASFIRIVTNLIKNMAESGKHSIQVKMKVTDRLEMEFRNDLMTAVNSRDEVTARLEQLVLELSESNASKKKGQRHDHLGLRSIDHLVKSCGGDFDFFIEEGEWVAKVSLPIVDMLMQIKEEQKLSKIA